MQDLVKKGSGETGITVISSASADGVVSQWQNRLLPLMKGMVMGLTAFFFLASCAQLVYLHQKIGQAPRLNANELMQFFPNSTEPNYQELVRLKVMIALEANTLERRHHQANVLLMSRLWIHYLGFVTGMILALVGAAFILGKLQEQHSDLGAKVGQAELSFKSASPGLMLVGLGTVLMLATVIVHHEITVSDAQVYTRELGLSPRTLLDSTPPPLPSRAPENKELPLDEKLPDSTPPSLPSRAPENKKLPLDEKLPDSTPPPLPPRKPANE